MFTRFLQKIFELGHPSGINSDHKYVPEVVKGTPKEPARSYALIRKKERQKGTNEWRLTEAIVSVSPYNLATE